MARIDGRDLVIEPAVREATEEHCFSRVDVEVGGFLLGNITESQVNVSASQPAETAQSGQTQLTFTHEAWDEVLSKMDTDFAGLQIVGWYHSHPGFGCFLSDYDIFIQENFFASQGQHALVIDPVAGEEAVFTAKDGTAHTVRSGSTSRSGLGANLVDQSGSEARAALIDQQVAFGGVGGPRRTGFSLAGVLGIIVLLLLSGGLGWFIGNLQGRGSERTSANAQVNEIQQQLSDTESALAVTEEQLAAAAELAEQEPEVVDSPANESTPEPAPAPTPGARTTVEIEYQIRSGDNLWTIAERFLGDGMQYPQLQKWNPAIKDIGLVPGDTIIVRVPATVVSGGE